ncbi:zinc-ribbon domain-containing protein [bacterium]|nr:zinc-ribbon domain-containing protein [bacterium]
MVLHHMLALTTSPQKSLERNKMPIEFTCDCGKKYRVKDAMAGKKASCAKCKQSFIVPQVSESSAPKKQVTAPPVKEQKSGRKSENPAALTNRSANSQEMYDRAAMFAWQKQLRIQEDLPGAWSLNLSDRIIEFTEDSKRFDIQIVGMEDLVTQKWIWAWADPKNDYSPELLRTVTKLKQFGVEQDIPEFVHGIFPLEIISGAEITTMTSGLVPCEGYWVAGEEDKFNVYFLMLSAEQSPREAPPASRVTRVIGESISSGTISDHRSAVMSYFKEIGYRPSTEGDSLLGTGPDGDSVRLSFDEANRITNINATATPAGAAMASNEAIAATGAKPANGASRTLKIGCATAAIVGGILLFLLIWPLIAVYLDGMQNADKQRLPDAVAPADQNAKSSPATNANQNQLEPLDLAKLKTAIVPFQEPPTGFVYNLNRDTRLLYDINLTATVQQQPVELKAIVGYKFYRGKFQFKSKININDLPPNSPLKTASDKWILESDGKLKLRPNGKLANIENGNTQLPLLLGPVSVLPFSVLPANEEEKEIEFSHFYRSFSEPTSDSGVEALLATRQNLSEESNRASFEYAFRSVSTESNEKVTFLKREGDLVEFERSFQWIAEQKDGEPGYAVNGTAKVEFNQANGVVTQTRFTGVASRVTESSKVDSPFELTIVLRR